MNTGIRAGSLRHRISAQVAATISDGADGYLPDQWASLRQEIAAEVVPLTGRDLERAQQIDPRLSHEVRVRYWPTYYDQLNGGRARVLYHDGPRDRVLEIIGPPVDVNEAHVEVRLLCREAA